MLLPVILAMLATTRLEISGDRIILSYSDSRDAVIFRNSGSEGIQISPLKIDIPGTWTLDSGKLPEISSNDLWPGISGDEYFYPLSSKAPAEWQAIGLPKGLSCSVDGKITGVPIEAGIFSVDVRASNNAGSVEERFPLKIFSDPLPRILTQNLPVAIRGVSYDFALRMNDSPSSILMSEKLPEGLTLTNDGKIYGVPFESGDYILDITAANEAGETSSKVSLKVSSTDLRITPSSLKAAHYGRPYNADMKLTGIDATEWEISGKLPEGLTFNAGKFSGTPKETGKFLLTLSGSNGAVKVRSEYSLTVNGDTPSISTSSMKQGFTGMPYNMTLRAASRTPVTWSVDKLPDGLILDTKTGMITGIPTEDFEGKLTLTAINAEGVCVHTLPLSIKTPVHGLTVTPVVRRPHESVIVRGCFLMAFLTFSKASFSFFSCSSTCFLVSNLS